MTCRSLSGALASEPHGKFHVTLNDDMLKANVCAACNDPSKLSEPLRSRFHFEFVFEPYTEEEFFEVVTTMLVVMEGKPRKLAEHIARRLAEFTRDPRKALGVARLTKDEEGADRIIEIMRRYSRG